MFLMSSGLLMAQNKCFCYDELKDGDSLDISSVEEITDTFEIVSIVSLGKQCCLFVNERTLQLARNDHKKFIKLIKKNNKCWVVADKKTHTKDIEAYLLYVRKGHSIYVVISQSDKNNHIGEKIQINKRYILTISPKNHINTFPKHGIRDSIQLNSIRYILDTGYLWFTNLYTTKDISGLYYTPQSTKAQDISD
jgi:hypothetical protein